MLSIRWPTQNRLNGIFFRLLMSYYFVYSFPCIQRILVLYLCRALCTFFHEGVCVCLSLLCLYFFKKRAKMAWESRHGRFGGVRVGKVWTKYIACKFFNKKEIQIINNINIKQGLYFQLHSSSLCIWVFFPCFFLLILLGCLFGCPLLFL